MSSMISLANYLRKTWAGVLFFTLFLWFSFHLLQGDRGYYSYKSSEQQLVTMQGEYAALKIRREKLENRVQRMRSNSLDPDLLDEQARIMLNRFDENEYILR